MKKTTLSIIALGLLIGGCASVPTGPSTLALPGTGKSFDDFRVDDYECRRFAHQQIGGDNAGSATADAGVRSAAVGTLVGALAGAAIGGRDGAAVGAGTGLLTGTMVGLGSGQHSSYDSQRQYDNAYVQCMYAKGQRVPVSGSYTSRPEIRSGSRPAGTVTSNTNMPPPPPPPGQPPPPPPDAPLR